MTIVGEAKASQFKPMIGYDTADGYRIEPLDDRATIEDDETGYSIHQL